MMRQLRRLNASDALLILGTIGWVNAIAMWKLTWW